MWFPFRKQVCWSTVHFPMSSLAPGVGSVTICLCLCPCLHVFCVDVLHQQSNFPGCKCAEWFWRVHYSLVSASMGVCVCVFRRWQRIMKEGWVKIHWRFHGRTGSLKLLRHNLSQASSGLNVRYEQTPDCTLGIPPLATQIIIALTKMYVNPSKLHLTPFNWV